MSEREFATSLPAITPTSAPAFPQHYILTTDLAETISRKFGLRLSPKTKRVVKNLEERFVSDFWPLIPDNVEKVALSASAVSQEMGQAVRGEIPLVTIDRVYLPAHGEYLGVSRRTDVQTGEVVGLAERPGEQPFSIQLAELPVQGRVALADSGALAAGTLSFVCSQLEKKGVEVVEVLLGVCTDHAQAKLNGRKVTAIHTTIGQTEWVEVRDLLGIDGRNVGLGPDGKREFMPYTENLTSWASIPEKNEARAKELCLAYHDKLFKVLRSNGVQMQHFGRPVPLRSKLQVAR